MSEYLSIAWSSVLAGIAISILVTLSLAFVRAWAGPSVFDRILALNMFGTKAVLLICVIAFWTNRTDFLDLALIFSLMNFIGMVALLKFTTTTSFQGDQVS